MLGLCVTGVSEPVLAQETRDEQVAAEQAEKAKQLHPYVPTTTERRLETAGKLLGAPPTVYPYLGSVFPGGWLAIGPGYRTRYGESGTFDAHGAWSLKNYKLADATLKLPDFADGRVTVTLRANWIDAPKVAFYGIGNASQQTDRTSFLYRSTFAGVSARIQPMRFFAVGAGLDALALDTGPGTSGTSIEQGFTAANTPGLGASPTYSRTRLFAEIDSRESPGYTRRGGLYRLDWFNYHQNSNGPYSFRRVDVEGDQFLPVLRANWVIAWRALASFTNTDADDAVPYFLMPDLGGGNELRGFPSWRFRDRDRILLSGEYRWMAGQFLDMALFVDAGKVAPRPSDLGLSDLKTSFGIGARFHTPTATVMRLDLARTGEGIGFIWAFDRSF